LKKSSFEPQKSIKMEQKKKLILKKSSFEPQMSNNNMYIKKDLKIKPHISIMATHIKPSKYFDSPFFYTTATAKDKKDKNYKGPLTYTNSIKKDNEYTILYAREVGQKSYYNYGNMTYDKINDIWKTNNNLYEILDDKPRKAYFDIDKYFISKEDTDNMLKQFYKLVFDTLGFDKKDAYISYGEGIKNDKLKISYHIIFNNGYYFENIEDIKKFKCHIEYLVNSNKDYDLLSDKVLDMKVYNKNQAFKLPYQSKPFGKIIQKPTKISTLSNFLITHNDGDYKYIDCSKFIETYKKVAIKNINGKIIKLDYNEANIINNYKLCFDKDYNHKVSDKKDNSLEYLLKSIPNNSKVSRDIWISIGYAIYNICYKAKREDGVKLWYEWTKDYKDDYENIEKEYLKMNSKGKGYGYKFLYNMASIFNKKMSCNKDYISPLFDDKPTDYDGTYQEIDSKYIDCKDFNLIDTVHNNDVLYIKSPMASGKSYTLHKLFSNNIEKSVLYISCKRAFAAAMTKEFKEDGFISYLDDENKYHLTDYNRVICSLESLHYCRSHYDIVIIDESETIATNINSKMFKDNKPIDCLNKLYDIMNNSKKILVMDAYLTKRSFDMVKNQRKSSFKSHYLKNNFVNHKRFYIELDKGQFITQILASIKDGEKIAICCGSYSMATNIYKVLKEKGIDYIHYDKINPLDLKECNNINDLWKNCKVLLYTPTITAGISYTNKDFDRLFVYGVNKGSCLFRDTIQAHKRIRHFNKDTIYIVINDKFRGHNKNDFPIQEDGVKEYHSKYKASLFQSIESLEYNDKFKWVYYATLYNSLESNINNVLYRDLALRYLKEENIHKGSSSKIEEYNCEDIEDIKYNDIENISTLKKMDIEENFTYNPNLITPENVNELVKYNFKNEFTRQDISEEVKETYYNEVYNKPFIRKQSQNIRNYIKMIDELEGDFTKFYEYRKLQIERNKNLEMIDISIKREEEIFRIMTALNMINGKEINIDKEIYTRDLNILNDLYKDKTDKELNTMFQDYKIRRNKNVKEIGTRQTRQIFDNLLKEQFNLYTKTLGTTSKRINGKPTKFTQIKVVNIVDKKQEQSDIIEDNKYNGFNIYNHTNNNVYIDDNNEVIKKPIEEILLGEDDEDYTSEEEININSSSDEDDLINIPNEEGNYTGYCYNCDTTKNLYEYITNEKSIFCEYCENCLEKVIEIDNS